MRWWPFGEKPEQESEPPAVVELSAMDRLLSKNCNREEFCLLYIKLLQERLPDTEIEMIDDWSVRMVRPDGKEAKAFMTNVWVKYSQNVEGRREMLEEFMSLATSLHDSSEGVSRERIVAKIKDSQYMTTMFKPEHEVMTEHLCGDLWIVYAEDLPDRIQGLKRVDISEAGIAESELRKLAIENLRRLLPSPEVLVGDSWHLLSADDNYTASLLLLDEVWDDLADSVEGDLVAVAPSRDILLCTGSRSEEGIAAIRQYAADVTAKGNYLISETLIVRSGGKWDVFNAN